MEFLPHHHTTRAVLLLLDVEAAVVEVEEVSVLMEQQWEDPLLKSVSPLITAPIHKQVLAARVTMNVAVEQDVPALQGFSHHHFGGAVFWALLHAWSNPLSVQIKAAERAPIISDDDTVWIQHRNNLEDKVVSQILGHFLITNQELEDALDDIARITLTRMNPTCDHDGTTYRYFLWSRAKIRDNSHLTVVAGKCLADYGLANSVLGFWLAELVEELSAV